MKKVSENLLTTTWLKMRLIHESEQTKIFLQGSQVTKFFLGDFARERFEKELAFYKIYSSHNLPHFLSSTSSPEFSITTSFLKGETPGFLDQTMSGLLTHKNFTDIREAIFHVQNLPNTSLLIHGDLAPHNIYMTDSRVVIADWDSYWYIRDSRYRMYDYAFLWSMLDFNEDYLARLFEEKELPDLKTRGLLNDFIFCYKRRISDLEKYGSDFRTGATLKKAILSLL